MEWTSIRTTLIAAAIAAALPGVAHAVRVDYTIDGGYEHDDNVTLSEVDPIEQNIARLGLGFAVEQASSVVRANVIGRIDHRRYQDVFDDMTDRMLEGRLHWEVVPDRLAFVVEDSYGVQTINRFNPDSPDNRQQVNVLSLGPTFMFRPGNLRGLAELRYINSGLKQQLPMLGICRGMQLLNVAKGGTLHLDINPQRKKTSRRPFVLPRKTVLVDANSQFGRILGKSQAKINSLHHQAVRQLGSGLTVAAYDLDHFVQAIESHKHTLLGVQWHPEYLWYLPSQLRLFRWLVQQCRAQMR